MTMIKATEFSKSFEIWNLKFSMCTCLVCEKPLLWDDLSVKKKKQHYNHKIEEISCDYYNKIYSEFQQQNLITMEAILVDRICWQVMKPAKKGKLHTRYLENF